MRPYSAFPLFLHVLLHHLSGKARRPLQQLFLGSEVTAAAFHCRAKICTRSHLGPRRSPAGGTAARSYGSDIFSPVMS